MSDGPLNLVQAIALAPAFVLVVFRVAGMMIFAPLFGSGRIPKRVKVLLALVMAMAMTRVDYASISLPTNLAGLVIGLAGELAFGLMMGLIMALVFVAAQWGGEMIGQQLGFNISETLDPQFGGGGSIVGEAYFLLTLSIFLIIDGHHYMLDGLHDSFTALPPLSLSLNRDLFDLLTRMLTATTVFALRLAAPTFVTMLIVDVSLGFLGKTMPQLNILTAGLSLRSLVGLIVVMGGLYMTTTAIESSLKHTGDLVRDEWNRPAEGP